MTPFIARARYYGPEGELLVIAITGGVPSGNPPVATCVDADGALHAIQVTDLRVLYRAPDWPFTDASSFVGEPRDAVPA